MVKNPRRKCHLTAAFCTVEPPGFTINPPVSTAKPPGFKVKLPGFIVKPPEMARGHNSELQIFLL